MIYTKNLDNLIPAFEKTFDALVVGDNALLARIPVGEPVKNLEAGWIDNVLEKLDAAVSGVTSSTISVAGDLADQIIVGAEVRNKKNANIYKVESKADNVLTVTGVNTDEDPITGTFVVDNIPLGVEGSTSGRKIFHQGAKKSQYTRIFRADAELSNSVIECDTYDESSYMITQTKAALVEIKNALASAIWFGKKSKTDADNTRSFDGLYEAAKNAGVTPISGNNGSITLAKLKELASQMKMKGGHGTHLFANPAAAGGLASLIDDKLTYTNKDTVIGAAPVYVRNPIDQTAIELVYDSNVPTGDIWLIDISGLEIHPLGKRNLQITDASTPATDAKAIKIIKEVVLFTKNAKQKLAYISGLNY